MPTDANIYHDEHSGGWIVEILALGEWYRLGVYGTERAARQAAKGAQS